jgi:hypothetical protein
MENWEMRAGNKISTVTFEYDNLTYVDELFHDAIVYCHVRIMKLIIKMNKTPDDPLDQQMLDYYNSKITAYEKMAATLSNS